MAGGVCLAFQVRMDDEALQEFTTGELRVGDEIIVRDDTGVRIVVKVIRRTPGRRLLDWFHFRKTDRMSLKVQTVGGQA